MKNSASDKWALFGFILFFCLACACGDRAESHVPKEYSDAEAQQLEADVDAMKKGCFSLITDLRKSIPETSHMKVISTAILSNRYCICAAREMERNLPVSVFRRRNQAEFMTFGQRSGGVCAMNILSDSWNDVCPPMMIRVVEMAKMNATEN